MAYITRCVLYKQIIGNCDYYQSGKFWEVDPETVLYCMPWEWDWERVQNKIKWRKIS